MDTPSYQPGQRIILGPYECDIEQQFGQSDAYLCRTQSHEKPLVLKYLPYVRGHDQGADTGRHRVLLAQRAFFLFKQVRSSLVAAGIPDMVFCDDVHQLVEYVPGDAISEGKDYSLQDIQSILLRIIDRVSALMEHGLVHGDLKTENVITSREDDLSISPTTTPIDFNLMGEAGGSPGVLDDSIMGTPYFMPSEQVCGRYYPTSDVFTTGMIALDTLANSSNYGVNFFEVHKDYDILHDLLAGHAYHTWIQPDARPYLEKTLFSQKDIDTRLARGIIDFFFACTRHNPKDRPQNGEEMRQILTDTGNITEI
ncbi:MAG: hypothetical protein WC101_02385 [Candidatus Gracilibacteria bacterium]